MPAPEPADKQKQVAATMVAQTVSVKDRVAFALALTNSAEEYFRGFRDDGAVYQWLHDTVAPWVTRLVGNGAIQNDALDAVLVRTIHAAAQQHFGQAKGARDPVLTALGEGNNAGRHVAERAIGLAEIPLLYPDKHNSTMSTIVAALRAEIRDEDGFNARTFKEAYQTTPEGVPWSVGSDGPYTLSGRYAPPALIQALLDKRLTDEAAEAVRAASEPLSVEERLLDHEARIKRLEAKG